MKNITLSLPSNTHKLLRKILPFSTYHLGRNYCLWTHFTFSENCWLQGHVILSEFFSFRALRTVFNLLFSAVYPFRKLLPTITSHIFRFFLPMSKYQLFRKWFPTSTISFSEINQSAYFQEIIRKEQLAVRKYGSSRSIAFSSNNQKSVFIGEL